MAITPCGETPPFNTPCGPQPKSKVTTITLGLLATVASGAGFFLLTSQLHKRIALGLAGAGALTTLAATTLWPKAKAEGGPAPEPLSAVELKTLVDSLDGEVSTALAERITHLRFADLAPLRDWKDQVDLFIKLIKACPNLEEIELDGVYEALQLTMQSAPPLLQAICDSPVQRIAGNELHTAAVVDHCLPDESDLKAYTARLTTLHSSWVKDLKASTALALVKQRSQTRRFVDKGIDDMEGADELLDYLFNHLSPEDVLLGEELATHLKARITGELNGEVSPAHKIYLTSVTELCDWDWNGLDADQWLKLVELTPNLEKIQLYADIADAGALFAEIYRRLPADKVCLGSELKAQWHAHIASSITGEPNEGQKRYLSSLTALHAGGYAGDWPMLDADGWIALLSHTEGLTRINFSLLDTAYWTPELALKVCQQNVTIPRGAWAMDSWEEGHVVATQIIANRSGALSFYIDTGKEDHLRRVMTQDLDQRIPLKVYNVNQDNIEKLDGVWVGRPITFAGAQATLLEDGFNAMIDRLKPSVLRFDLFNSSTMGWEVSPRSSSWTKLEAEYDLHFCGEGDNPQLTWDDFKADPRPLINEGLYELVRKEGI